MIWLNYINDFVQKIIWWWFQIYNAFKEYKFEKQVQNSQGHEIYVRDQI